MDQTATSIFTETETNELEVVEFFVDERPYAINVAKVREIIRPACVMAVPESHPSVLGVFQNRDEVLPLVDLGKWLGGSAQSDPGSGKIIVTEFNQTKVGFLVHGVSRIHRVSWSSLESPPEGSIAQSPSALGFIRLGGQDGGERIVFLLDFERIVAELGRKSAIGVPGEVAGKERRQGKVVLVAEDSFLIRKALTSHLERGGFTVRQTANGEEAWRYLEEGSPADLVISDIEMPRMGGHHLTKRIKSDARLEGMPVVLYSSMIREEVRRKGDALGADAQICKPDLGMLLETVDELIFGS